MNERFDRHMPLFGTAGQARIRETRVGVVGVGGIGSHVVQQLAYLGVRMFGVVDPDELETTNLNRLIGSRFDDAVPGTRKVEIATRTIRSIVEDAEVVAVPRDLLSEEAFGAVKRSHVVFGCIDNEGARLVLTELCAAYDIPYIDVGSDVLPGDPPQFGGQVCTSWGGRGCLVCLGELDIEEARRDLAGADGIAIERDIYGIERQHLEGGGPAVVSVNGAVASLAVTEFMAGVTRLREPVPLIRYRGWTPSITRGLAPDADCYYCRGIRGKGERAGAERYLQRKPTA
jgi:molybdopterin-synthase adenylyltransferase